MRDQSIPVSKLDLRHDYDVWDDGFIHAGRRIKAFSMDISSYLPGSDIRWILHTFHLRTRITGQSETNHLTGFSLLRANKI